MKFVVAILVGGALTLAGCSSSGPIKAEQPMDPAQERLLTVGLVYREFNQERRRPPKKAADLQPLLARRGAPADVLTSPRDGQPFVVCWGTEMVATPKWAKSRPLLAWEKQGLAGTRYVLTTLRNVELLSDEEFAASSIPPGYSAGG